MIADGRYLIQASAACRSDALNQKFMASLHVEQDENYRIIMYETTDGLLEMKQVSLLIL